jgi:hypothetical protein
MTKNLLYVLGVVFVLIGLLGFVNSPVLGLFEVNILHNLIHLVSGVLLLMYAGKSSAKTVALVLGIVYGLVTVLGFLMGGNILGLISVNMADNLLHLVLAAVLLVVGLTGRSAAPAATMPTSTGPIM